MGVCAADQPHKQAQVGVAKGHVLTRLRRHLLAAPCCLLSLATRHKPAAGAACAAPVAALHVCTISAASQPARAHGSTHGQMCQHRRGARR